MKPMTQLLDVGVITRGGMTTRDDGPLQQIQLVAQKKVQFDVDVKKENVL